MLLIAQSRIIYRALADLVVIVHAAYVLFVILGLMLILLGMLARWEWTRNFWFRSLHLAMIGIVVVQAWFGRSCPLTIWEQRLRLRAGQATYPGDFIGHWMHELIFVDVAPGLLSVCYTLFGLAVLATFVWAPPHWPARGGSQAMAQK